MKKTFLIYLILALSTFLNAQINYNTAKLYKDDISAKQAYKMQEDGALLIDVRTKAEFKELRAVNSINIPIFYAKNGKRAFNKSFLREIYQASNKNLSKKIILICRSGSRTKLASNLLAEQGFNDIYNVKYGFKFDWLKAKLPTQK
ncbi:rhodanese-like domain-containing protein [Arcobacter peruensis]|uniref:rhodanese-like domain-containing protein n=1 Tax=Arcobacter peruensis TaxID=2320140 RepID=UPI000F093A16|nr:rhodanese-like domain-containing protein [Arcobacter peruensis]